LREQEAGAKAGHLAHEYSAFGKRLYNWKAKFGGILERVPRCGARALRRRERMHRARFDVSKNSGDGVEIRSVRQAKESAAIRKVDASSRIEREACTACGGFKRQPLAKYASVTRLGAGFT
jgi:hypothetical protein